MSKLFLPIFASIVLCGQAGAEVAYDFVPDFIKPPTGKATIGDGHGEIACDSAGNFYVSVKEKGAGGIQVYGPDGSYLKALNLPESLHGFVVRKDGDGEFLFGAVLDAQSVIKAKLDGTVVMEIPTSAFPEDQRNFVSVSEVNAEDIGKPKPGVKHLASGVRQSDSKTELVLRLADGSTKTFTKGPGLKVQGGRLSLTNCDVASNGDIYVVDGYGRSWIFVFSRDGKFKKVFGGPDAPYNFKNTHKIFVDKRFSPERIVALDRGNNRMLHLDLDGGIISTIADQGLRNPSSASFHGDLMCVAEIAGRVSVWDKDNKMVAELGANPKSTNTPGIEPKNWNQGMVTSPHGITFDNDGNVLETEWNAWGRVLRWNRRK
jgi:6-bladed beta-propeller